MCSIHSRAVKVLVRDLSLCGFDSSKETGFTTRIDKEHEAAILCQIEQLESAEELEAEFGEVFKMCDNHD